MSITADQTAHVHHDTAPERIHALEVTAARLAEERDRAIAAGFRLDAENRRLRAVVRAACDERDQAQDALVAATEQHRAELGLAHAAAQDIAATVADVMRENGRLHDRLSGLEELRREVERYADTPRWRRRR